MTNTVTGRDRSTGYEIDTCWCGIDLIDHDRCAGCGILVGPEHITRSIGEYRGKQYCDSCLGGRRRKDVKIRKSPNEKAKAHR